MKFPVNCSQCGKKFQVEQKHGGKRATCPGCGNQLTIPVFQLQPPTRPGAGVESPPPAAPAASEPPAPTSHPAAPVLLTSAEPPPPPKSPPDHPYAPPAVPYVVYAAAAGAEPQTDAPGVISLIFGILGLVLLVFGCIFSCLFGFLLYPIAALLAAVGLALSFAGKGNLRVAGITLNALVLVPAAIMAVITIMLLLVGGAAASVGG